MDVCSFCQGEWEDGDHCILKKMLNFIMVLIMVCCVSVLDLSRGEDWSGEPKKKKRTDSISENVRKHCRGDHDDDESFAAPEL